MSDTIEIYHNVCIHDFDHLDFDAEFYAKRLEEYLGEEYPACLVEIEFSSDVEILTIDFPDDMEWRDQMDFERDLKQEIREFADKLIEGDI